MTTSVTNPSVRPVPPRAVASVPLVILAALSAPRFARAAAAVVAPRAALGDGNGIAVSQSCRLRGRGRVARDVAGKRAAGVAHGDGVRGGPGRRVFSVHGIHVVHELAHRCPRIRGVFLYLHAARYGCDALHVGGDAGDPGEVHLRQRVEHRFDGGHVAGDLVGERDRSAP